MRSINLGGSEAMCDFQGRFVFRTVFSGFAGHVFDKSRRICTVRYGEEYRIFGPDVWDSVFVYIECWGIVGGFVG